MTGYRFQVDVQQLPDGWEIAILVDGSRDAVVRCDTLDTALRMAVPYMASVCVPDPFARLFEGSD